MRNETFSLKQALPLPKDIHVWVPASLLDRASLSHPETKRKPPCVHVAGTCDGRSCSSRHCGVDDAGRVDGDPVLGLSAPAGTDRFLAISPGAASYITLDIRFLPAFMLLLDGHPPSLVGSWCDDIHPARAWTAFLRDLLRALVLRNFREGARTKQDDSDLPMLTST